MKMDTFSPGYFFILLAISFNLMFISIGIGRVAAAIEAQTQVIETQTCSGQTVGVVERE